MIDYDFSIVDKLRDIPFVAQGGVGNSPSQWAREMGIDHEFELPSDVLSREQVYGICQSPQEPILKAYLIVMAWGAQGRGPGGKKTFNVPGSTMAISRSEFSNYGEEIYLEKKRIIYLLISTKFQV